MIDLTKTPVRRLLLLVIIFLAICGTVYVLIVHYLPRGNGKSSLDTLREQQETITRFQPYQLSDYTLSQWDVVEGLGGRWISLRYQLNADANADAPGIRARLTDSLAKAGWTPRPLPEGKYVLSRIFETSPGDLSFAHDPFPGDPSYFVYHQMVHVSDDGKVVVCYCEIVW